MPSLQVRELPEHVYRKLLEEAKREHRSLAQQAVVTLERALNIQKNPQERRRAVLRKISENPTAASGDSFKEPAKLIREDRER